MSRPFKIVVGIFLTLFLLFFVAGIVPWMLTGAFHLGVGWITHATTVLPKVTVDWSSVGMMAACVLLSGFFGHRFCSWLWKSNGNEGPWRLRWTASGLGLIVLLFAAGMSFTAVAHQTGWLIRSKEPLLSSSLSPDRLIVNSLRSLASAQSDFRLNDRDADKETGFWRKDIAGLYTLSGPDGRPLMIIDRFVAAADDRPVTPLEADAKPVAWVGFYFRSLRFDGEKTPDPARFAAIAYPATPATGKWMYLLTMNEIPHGYSLYRKVSHEGALPESCPDDPAKEGWLPY